jgi:CubicO group peptidase (beta-lactamase class C family)
MRGPVVALLLVLSGMAVSGVSPAPADDNVVLFGRYLDGLRRQLGIPGLSVLILEQQQVVWEQGLGVADQEASVAAAPDTPFHVASLTKTFASVLLLQCAERGALDLDAPIRTYTAAIPEPGATVRHVLTHTSEGTPGQAFRYNGDRYAALTAVVESCWRQPIRLVLASAILDRLAMRETVPGPDLESPDTAAAAIFDPATLDRYRLVLARVARPYATDSRGRSTRSMFPPRVINAAAGLVSTVRDLARYDRAIDEHILLRPATQELAWTPARTTSGQPLPYGLGWFVQTVEGERVVWHYGLWGSAYSALLLKVPARQLTLILLANSDGLSARFPMAAGDVLASPFATAFLRIVVGSP